MAFQRWSRRGVATTDEMRLTIRVQLFAISMLITAMVLGLVMFSMQFSINEGFSKHLAKMELSNVEKPEQRRKLVSEIQSEFVSEQLRNLLMITVTAFGCAAVPTFLVSQYWLNGINTILQASRKLSSGDYSTRIEDKRQDELGELAREFNALAKALEEADQTQRQWVADTSHELRTPIAILRAQVEAFQDGVQAINAKTLTVLHNEVMALNKLVDDLHWLARHDVGQVQSRLNPTTLASSIRELVEGVKERFDAKKLTIDDTGLATVETVMVNADVNRMRQVFSNLLENSFRYTNPGGTVKISGEANSTSLILRVDDSEPGVPAEMLPKMFDRFFRVEQSRSRSLGGSGLGLSICKNFVSEHGGTIEALPSPLGGVRMEIKLPIVAEEKKLV